MSLTESEKEKKGESTLKRQQRFVTAMIIKTLYDRPSSKREAKRSTSRAPGRVRTTRETSQMVTEAAPHLVGRRIRKNWALRPARACAGARIGVRRRLQRAKNRHHASGINGTNRRRGGETCQRSLSKRCTARRMLGGTSLRGQRWAGRGRTSWWWFVWDERAVCFWKRKSKMRPPARRIEKLNEKHGRSTMRRGYNGEKGFLMRELAFKPRGTVARDSAKEVEWDSREL
ncbi:hypothetical protein HD554DRAFT_2114746 [Boletus coccyginus]|nr:hypothetical protein HD554DRAFT_2114746 [Boletus coccyginus]